MGNVIVYVDDYYLGKMTEDEPFMVRLRATENVDIAVIVPANRLSRESDIGYTSQHYRYVPKPSTW